MGLESKNGNSHRTKNFFIEQKSSSFSLAKFFVPSYNGEKKGRRIENDTTRDFCKEFGYLR